MSTDLDKYSLLAEMIVRDPNRYGEHSQLELSQMKLEDMKGLTKYLQENCTDGTTHYEMCLVYNDLGEEWEASIYKIHPDYDRSLEFSTDILLDF